MSVNVLFRVTLSNDLLNDPNASLLAWSRRASLPRRISQRQSADADILFIHIESLHELLALLSLDIWYSRFIQQVARPTA